MASVTGSIDEPVPQPDHCLDLPRRFAELASEPADVDVDGPRFDRPVVAPDALEQTVARHDAVLVLHQIPEQLELASRQANGIAVDGDGHRFEIGDEMIS